MRTKTKHACPWCGAVLPNTLLGDHVRDWHDEHYHGQNKMTSEQQLIFKAGHYNYESTDPIAIDEKKRAKKFVKNASVQREDIRLANELARKYNEEHEKR